MKKQFRITLNGKSYDVVAELMEEDGSSDSTPSGGQRRPARSGGASAVARTSAKKAPAPAPADGAVPSPLAGTVVSVDVARGDSVEAGENIITLEAMKMNTVVSSPVAGTVKEIHVTAGDAVEEGQPLLTIE